MGCLGKAKGFEGVGVERAELISFFGCVDEEDLQFLMVYGAVSISAEVGVFEGVLVRDVNATIGDEDRESMCRVRVGAEEGSE